MDDLQTLPPDAEQIERLEGLIYLLKDGREIPLRLSRYSDKFHGGVVPEDDWLQVGGDQRPPALAFTCIAQTAERLHFNIGGTGKDAQKKLGISRNGYLGLYYNAEVTDFWKLEPLKWTEKGLVCRWRDHRGHTVKALPDRPHYRPGVFHYLNVELGEECEFLLVRVK